jgi:dimethylargininase
MGNSSREGEQDTIAAILSEYLDLHYAKEPATIEGGDIIHLENRLISGATQRTNDEGISQASDWLDVDILTIEDPSIIHLKSYATYLGENNLLVSKKFANYSAFEGLNIIIVPEDECYAANSLSLGGITLLPEGFNKTKELIEEIGREVITLDVSEIEKCEGALTCLSLLF